MSHLGRSWNDIAADLQHRAPLLLAENLPPALQSFVAGQTYAALFAQVFGSPGVTPARIVFAIAAYERTLIADQSPLDQYLAGTGNLSSQELQGFQVFALLCIACHTDVNVTVLGTGPVLNDFRNIGLRPVADDPGRFAITNLPADRGRFKVPSLRNVALRAPYFHNGRLLTLGEVIDFYSRGGDFADNRDPLLARIPGRITAGDRAALIAFLQAMTDPRVAAETAPFDRPRLFSASQRVPNVFGTGTIGSGGQSPAVVALSPPYLGNARWSLGVDRVQAVAFQWLLWDVSANFSPTVVLGQNVFLGMTPSLALTGLPALTQGSGANGHGTVAFAIPANTSLRGASLFCQWLLTDPQGPNGFVTSDAFGFTVF